MRGSYHNALGPGLSICRDDKTYMLLMEQVFQILKYIFFCLGRRRF